MKLRDVFILSEKVLNANTRGEALYEWWKSDSTLYRQGPIKIASKWLDEANKIIPPPKMLPKFPETVIDPRKEHDYLLRYIATCVQEPTYKTVPIKFQYPVRGVQVNFVFVINDNAEELTTTGGTNGKKGTVKWIKVEVPYGRFLKIYEKLKNGKECYSDAEDFIADTNMTIAHELTHSVQHLRGTGVTSDVLSLDDFKTNKDTEEIRYFLYFITHNEIKSTMSEAYKLYTKRGSGMIPHNTGVEKKFLRCLATAVLRRFKEYRKALEEYNKGQMSLLQLINKTHSSVKLMLVWSLFIFAPDEKLSSYDELVRDDPDYSLASKFNLHLVKQNIKNLVEVFSEVNKKQTLQTEFIREWFVETDENFRKDFLANIFSIHISNETALNGVLEWIEDKKNPHIIR